MLALFNNKIFLYGLLVVAVISGFYMWQGKREATKQLEEKTKQLQVIMDNPIERVVEGPVRIVEGKTIVKTIVKEIKADGTSKETVTETITEPKITEKGKVVRDTDYKDPIGEAEAKKRKFMVFGGYSFDDRISFGMGMTLFNRLNCGTLIVYNIKEKNVAPGFQVAVLF